MITANRLEQLRKRLAALWGRLLRKAGRDFIALVTKIEENRVILVRESLSGSNTHAMYAMVSDEMKKKYDIVLYQDREVVGWREFWDKHRIIASAKIIVTTHASYKPTRKHIHIQLWHGALVKKNGVMLDAAEKQEFSPPRSWRRVSYIISYSETYTTLMNACMVTDPSKYVITGGPRNDYLFMEGGRRKLCKLMGRPEEKKRFLFFLPTFREYGSRGAASAPGETNVFGFQSFDLTGFISFLERCQCVLLVKPHPHNQTAVYNYFKKHESETVVVLSDRHLTDMNCDLYELLSAAAVLITDYSSVYYDFLLTDRPIIFCPVDMERYTRQRGFLVESFDAWAPGPKVLSQPELELAITKSLEVPECFAPERRSMKELMHRFKDGSSSQRVWELIERSSGGVKTEL